MRHLIALAASCFVMAEAGTAAAGGTALREEQAVIGEAMEQGQFWTLVERSRQGTVAKPAQGLRTTLAALTPEDLVAFQTRLHLEMRRSYTWDLWGAAFVAMGGASDDGFEYFRLWLISRGREAFERALLDADTLADIAPADVDAEAMTFEEFAYVAPEIWSARTGKPLETMPLPELGYGDPGGEPFSEDAKALARRYPRLSRRFMPS